MHIRGNTKLLAALAAIILATFTTVHCASHREVTDVSTLSYRAIDALKDVKSYRFTISTNLSMPAQEENIGMISGEGCVDYRNKKMQITMTIANRSVETVVIGDIAYVRESNRTWQRQELDGRPIWENGYDQLAQQRSILLNATNATMHTDDNGWILDIVPDKEEVIEQMGKTGLEMIREEELKSFTIRYWIGKDSYHITRMENRAHIKMNIKGMVTPMELNNVVYFDGYNERMEIVAPVQPKYP
jgi:hypothetical protein